MNHTSIEWVLNPDGSLGYTWNPITGCLNGCEYCYARKLANTRMKERYLANKNWDTAKVPGSYDGYPNLDPFYPRFWPERLSCQFSFSGKKAQGIFVCDMSDLFGIGIPERWTEQVMQLIGAYPQHRFYLLTKQPQNLAKFSPFPDNCYVGVTVTNREQAHFASMYLPSIEAKVKYISFEPLLDDVMQALYCGTLIRAIDWVIIGAQTKPTKKPEWQWVKDIIEAADTAGIPVFLKNNLGLLKLSCEGAAPFYREHSSGTMALLQNVAECSKREVPV